MHQWGAWLWVTWFNNPICPEHATQCRIYALSVVVDIICRYNHTVHVTPYMPCWLTVVCYLQGMPDRMLCAVLEQFQLYFSRWYVRFVSVSVWYPCILTFTVRMVLIPHYMQPRYWLAVGVLNGEDRVWSLQQVRKGKVIFVCCETPSCVLLVLNCVPQWPCNMTMHNVWSAFML